MNCSFVLVTYGLDEWGSIPSRRIIFLYAPELGSTHLEPSGNRGYLSGANVTIE
jgi:hypothetical protein